ncbi:hypothetical protein HY008_03310 [Candidatus Woesebacteria bacterium]|nr:hypothetical protein [Candidatus Woesebacteria bacterium]
MKGQSLFEVLIALGVIAVIVVAVVSLGVTSVRNNVFSRNNALATKFSHETMEWVRGERDRSWTTFVSRMGATSSGSFCLTSSPPSVWPSLGPCASNQTINDTQTPFVRQLSLTCYNRLDLATPIGCSGGSTDTIEALVVTSWTDAQGVHDARSSTYFTNWRDQ